MVKQQLGLGLSSEELREQARRVNRTFARMAMRHFGHARRDPNRIPRLVKLIGAIWVRHPALTFGQLLEDVWAYRAELGWRGGFRLVEDGAWEALLGAWAAAHPAVGTEMPLNRQDKMTRVLTALDSSWFGSPDSRLGQHITNVIRDRLSVVSDEAAAEALEADVASR